MGDIAGTSIAGPCPFQITAKLAQKPTFSALPSPATTPTLAGMDIEQLMDDLREIEGALQVIADGLESVRRVGGAWVFQYFP